MGSRKAAWRSRRRGWQTSSASMRAMASPRAAASPAVKAATMPPWGCRGRAGGRRAGRGRAAPPGRPASVEPSSTATISKSPSVWANRLSRAAGRLAAAFRTGMTTEIIGRSFRRQGAGTGRRSEAGASGVHEAVSRPPAGVGGRAGWAGAQARALMTEAKSASPRPVSTSLSYSAVSTARVGATAPAAAAASLAKRRSLAMCLAGNWGG